jgi:predicted transcriptional regulator
MLYLPIVQYMAETTTIDRLAAMATDNEPLSEAALKRIEEALEDLKQGRYYTEEEFEAELDLG